MCLIGIRIWLRVASSSRGDSTSARQLRGKRTDADHLGPVRCRPALVAGVDAKGPLWLEVADGDAEAAAEPLTEVGPTASDQLTKPPALTRSNCGAAIGDGATSSQVAILSARLDISLG
jgi:hypothetical protein